MRSTSLIIATIAFRCSISMVLFFENGAPTAVETVSFLPLMPLPSISMGPRSARFGLQTTTTTACRHSIPMVLFCPSLEHMGVLIPNFTMQLESQLVLMTCFMFPHVTITKSKCSKPMAPTSDPLPPLEGFMISTFQEINLPSVPRIIIGFKFLTKTVLYSPPLEHRQVQTLDFSNITEV